MLLSWIWITMLVLIPFHIPERIEPTMHTNKNEALPWEFYEIQGNQIELVGFLSIVKMIYKYSAPHYNTKYRNWFYW